MPRWGALLGMLVAIVLLAVGSGAASSSIDPADYVGDWTADTSSQGPAATQLFTIATSDETTTRADSGANSINFDNYCQQDTGNAEYECVDGDHVRNIKVEVSKSDPHEQDACPVRATGSLWMVDGDGTHTTDSFRLDIPKCEVALAFAKSRIKKGSKNTVAVAMNLNAQGY